MMKTTMTILMQRKFHSTSFLREYDDDYVVVNSFKVKKCGIRLLYLQDAKEFSITDSRSGIQNSDSTSVDSEQCETEMVDSNYKRRRVHH